MSDQFGPVDVICPYCGDEVHVDAGPTRRCEIKHCDGKWFVVDLENAASGHITNQSPTDTQEKVR